MPSMDAHTNMPPKKMSAEEMAKQIQNHCLAHGGICSGPEVIAVIAAALRQYRDEGYQEGWDDRRKGRSFKTPEGGKS